MPAILSGWEEFWMLFLCKELGCQKKFVFNRYLETQWFGYPSNAWPLNCKVTQPGFIWQCTKSVLKQPSWMNQKFCSSEKPIRFWLGQNYMFRSCLPCKFQGYRIGRWISSFINIWICEWCHQGELWFKTYYRWGTPDVAVLVSRLDNKLSKFVPRYMDPPIFTANALETQWDRFQPDTSFFASNSFLTCSAE